MVRILTLTETAIDRYRNAEERRDRERREREEQREAEEAERTRQRYAEHVAPRLMAILGTDADQWEIVQHTHSGVLGDEVMYVRAVDDPDLVLAFRFRGDGGDLYLARRDGDGWRPESDLGLIRDLEELGRALVRRQHPIEGEAVGG